MSETAIPEALLFLAKPAFCNQEMQLKGSCFIPYFTSKAYYKCFVPLHSNNNIFCESHSKLYKPSY